MVECLFYKFFPIALETPESASSAYIEAQDDEVRPQQDITLRTGSIMELEPVRPSVERNVEDEGLI